MSLPTNTEPNYPDILGYVTDGKRLTLSNIVEVALAVHPQVIRSGQPFEVIAIMQNVTDVNIQVKVTLGLPKEDASKAAGRFLTKNAQMNIALHPAETGYLALPAISYPGTTPADYKVDLELEVRPLEKPRRIRQKPESKADVNLNYYFSLSEESINHLAALKSLTFSDSKRGMFGKALEAPFSIVPGKGGRLLRKSPEWISLWSLGTDTDVRPLLERHHELLVQKILPYLKAFHLYDPLYKSTRDRFHIAGYPIRDVEIHYIVKLMINILEMGNQKTGPETYSGENMYRVAGLIEHGWPTDGRPIPLPHWCRRLLFTVGFDDRVIEKPIDALARPLYEDLVRDAIWHGFKLLHHDTQVDLGSDDDVKAYTEQILRAFWEPDRALDFIDVHMPLVLGGLLADERVQMASENKLDYFHSLLNMYEEKQYEYNLEELGLFFDLAEHLVDNALKRHGFWVG